jgi:DNA-binding response OmpR family regulator
MTNGWVEVHDATPVVLVAEDDWEVRQLVVAALELEGCRVRDMHDGAQLLDYARVAMAHADLVDPPDLVITDLRMPAWTGLQVIEFMRSNGWHTPVILITAFGDEETRRRAAELGAVMLAKPFDLVDLQAAVNDALSARRGRFRRSLPGISDEALIATKPPSRPPSRPPEN